MKTISIGDYRIERVTSDEQELGHSIWPGQIYIVWYDCGGGEPLKRINCFESKSEAETFVKRRIARAELHALKLIQRDKKMGEFARLVEQGK